MRETMALLLKLILTVVEQVGRKGQEARRDEKQKSRDVAESDPSSWFNTHFGGLRRNAQQDQQHLHGYEANNKEPGVPGRDGVHEPGRRE